MVEGGRTRDDEGSGGGGGEGSASATAAEGAMKSKAEVARLLEAQGHNSVRVVSPLIDCFHTMNQMMSFKI